MYLLNHLMEHFKDNPTTSLTKRWLISFRRVTGEQNPNQEDYITFLFRLLDKFDSQEKPKNVGQTLGHPYVYKNRSLICFFAIIILKRCFAFKAMYRWLSIHHEEARKLGFSSIPSWWIAYMVYHFTTFHICWLYSFNYNHPSTKQICSLSKQEPYAQQVKILCSVPGIKHIECNGSANGVDRHQSL